MALKDCWRTVVVCLVLVIGTVALYSSAFTFGFANLQDEIYVVANPHVNKGLTGDGLKWAFQAGYASNWHPLTWISHMVDVQIYKGNAGGHHATSIALHALNAALVFLVMLRMTGFFWRSAVIAAFFAWHPLQVESVAWIAERKDVLCAFFGLLTVWMYLFYTERSKARLPSAKVFYVAAFLFFALGLMAKPMLVTLPCILLLIDWWPLRRLPSCVSAATPAQPGSPQPPPGPSIPFLLMEKVPFLILSIGSCVVTFIAAHREALATAGSRMPLKVRVVTAAEAYFRYLEKLVWPSDLGVTYPFMFHRPKIELAMIALVLLGITVLAFQFRKSRPYWLMGWAWFVVMVAPTLNLVFFADEPMADHYMYLPCIGLLILICWDAAELTPQLPSARIVLAGVCAVALAGCCAASWLQLRYWKNEGTLISHIAEPDINYPAHASYASFLRAHNLLPSAEAECEKAISIMPGYVPLHVEMGEIFLAEGKYDDAINEFKYVQKADPRLVGIHLPWGRALLFEKKIDAAVAEFRTVLSVEPKNADAHKFLGAAFMDKGETRNAMDEFRNSLGAQPNQPDLLNNVAWILATDPHPELRNGAAAVKLAGRACEMTRGTQPAFLGTLAAALAEVGQYTNAVAIAQKAHDTAIAEANAAEKANQLPAARALQALAKKDLELLDVYKSQKPYRDAIGKSGTPATPQSPAK